MAKKKNGVNIDTIVDEIRGKSEDYENRMSPFLSDYNVWSDMFTMKSPTKKSVYSNPQTTQMHRAVETLSSLEYRLLTAQDPNFEIVPMDILAEENIDGRMLVQEVLRTQLDKINYRAHLLKAIKMKYLFGTVIVEQPFEMIRLSHLGRKMPATGFQPRSMLQVYFDKDTYDIDKADWLMTSDICNTKYLEKLAEEYEDGDKVWIKSELSKATSDEACYTGIPAFIQARLTASGYNTSSYPKTKRELITYYGKLDCYNDGIDYVVGIVNRKYLVKFYPSTSQSGKRPFRVAKFVDWELEPLGYGLGGLFGKLHKAIAETDRQTRDLTRFSTLSMFMRHRLSGISDESLKARSWGIVDTDDMQGLAPIQSNTNAITEAMNLQQRLENEFKVASGATDTLQAVVSEATATETAIVQNEAIRRASVNAEMTADKLIRETLEYMHENNTRLISEPFTINVNGVPRKVYPNDLLLDVDFRVKIVTDKDFKPKRVETLISMLQNLTSIRNDHPDKLDINILPIVKELAISLGMNPNQLLKSKEEMMEGMARMATMAQIQNAGNIGQGQGAPQPNAEMGPESAGEMMSTPVGPVGVSPVEGV